MSSTQQPPSSSRPSWADGLSWHMPEWVEPTMIVSIMLVTMWFTRRKDATIFGPSNPYLPLRERDSSTSPSRSPSPRSSSDDDRPQSLSHRGHHSKRRKLFGGLLTVRTPNSSRFAKNFHSRILQKFPFLIEMFYWAVTFFFYRFTTVMAQVYYGGDKKLWDVAQEHALGILEFETNLFGSGWRTGTDRWTEWRIHTWFLAGAEAGDWRRTFLTVLNRSYALIHIPGTAGFIAYYYWACPTHNRFCTVRRTMSLLNMYAFTIFVFVPTMPPRFLPKEYGFVDTVNAEDAESVWMSGKFVNRLAAMPSMHFGYAFLIGATFIYESGIFRRWVGARPFAGDSPSRRVKEDAEGEGVGLGIMSADGDVVKPGERQFGFRNFCFLLFGIWYPCWVLLTIVATANHYFADAFVAACGSLVAFAFNRVLLNLLPLEDLLLWVLRLEKPEPTTGLKQ